MGTETPSAGETAAAIRAWVGDAVRRLAGDIVLPNREELATVESGWQNRGQGWPDTVGEPPKPAQVQVRPDRYQITLTLPPEIPEPFATRLGGQLRQLALDDQTLGSRVRSADIPESGFEPTRVSNQDFGDGAWQLVTPVVVYQLEQLNINSD